jgi:hypothetical protein
MQKNGTCTESAQLCVVGVNTAQWGRSLHLGTCHNKVLLNGRQLFCEVRGSSLPSCSDFTSQSPIAPPFARDSLEVSIPCFCVVGAPFGHNRGRVSIDGHVPPLDHKSDALGSYHDGQALPRVPAGLR